MNDVRQTFTEEYRTHIQELTEQLNDPSADLDAIKERMEVLEANYRKKCEILEQRASLEADINKRISEGRAKVVAINEARTEKDTEELYRRAWLKDMARGRFGEMSVEERDAFVHMTTNSESVIPRIIEDKIYSLVRESYGIIHYVAIKNIRGVFEATVHKSIKKGDAKVYPEGADTETEENEFKRIRIPDDRISKLIEISFNMHFASITDFEDYLVAELAERISIAINARILDAVRVGKDADNVVTIAKAKNLTSTDMRVALSKLKTKKRPKIYCSTNVLWLQLAGIGDENGRPMFMATTSGSDSPETGVFYGVPVVVDDTLDDNTIYIGDASEIAAATTSGMQLMSEVKVINGNRVMAAHQTFGAALINPRAFVSIQFATA